MAKNERAILLSNNLFTVKHCVGIVPGFDVFVGRSTGEHIQRYMDQNPVLPQLYTISYLKDTMGGYTESAGAVAAFDVSLIGCGPQYKSNKHYIVVCEEVGLRLLERVSWWDMGVSRATGLNLYTKTHLYHLYIDRGMLPEDLAESFKIQLAAVL